MLVTATEWEAHSDRRACPRNRASGIGAALRASELKADVLMVGQGRLKVPAASAAAFNLLKLAGAAYLLYLAWLSFRSGLSKASLQGARFPGYVALYRRGVITVNATI